MSTSAEYLTVACFVTIYFWICIVFLIYGIIKWVQFQHHFLITKRFPAVTNAILFGVGLTILTNMCRRWIDYHYGTHRQFEGNFMWGVVSGIPQSASFLYLSLVIYRILLIYLRYNMSQNEIKTLIDKITNKAQATTTENVISLQNKNLYETKYSIVFIIYITTCVVFIAICHTRADWIKHVAYPWTTIILLGIFFVIFVKCKKVKEGLGCLKEAYILLTYLFINVVISMSFGNGIYMQYLHSIIVPITGFLPLYFSLYCVYKSEGSLTKIHFLNRYNDDIFEPSITSMNSINSLKSQSSMTETERSGTRHIEIDLEIGLFDFLKSKDNYKLFVGYLAHCFCLENILFLQTVCIYYQNIMKLVPKTNDRNENESNDDKKSKKPRKKLVLRRMKFKYLEDLHNQYENKISEMKGKEFNDYNRNVLYDIAKEIYDEYIDENGVNAINISYDCRMNLKFYFKDKTHLEKLATFGDFANMFDTAAIQIYRLMMSMYNYRFEEYANDLK